MDDSNEALLLPCRAASVPVGASMEAQHAGLLHRGTEACSAEFGVDTRY